MANKILQINIGVNTAFDDEKSIYDLILTIINKANDCGYPVNTVFLDNDIVLDESGLKKINIY